MARPDMGSIMRKLDEANRDRLQAQKPANAPEKKESTELERRFGEILKGVLHEIPTGSRWESELPNVETVALLPPATPELKDAWVNIRYKKGGRIFSKSIPLTNDGRLRGAQKELKEFEGMFSEKDLMREVLDSAEELGIGFWVDYDWDILSKGEWDKDSEKSERVKGDGGQLSKLELERIEFLRKQPGVVFGFINKRDGGFEGYRGFVFQSGFVVLEHPRDNNAVYIIDGTPKISKQKLTKKLALKLLAKKYNLPAIGVINYEKNNIKPLIYVKNTDSLVWENACGSGSLAYSLISGYSKIVQPSGQIIDIRKTGRFFTIKVQAKIVK